MYTTWDVNQILIFSAAETLFGGMQTQREGQLLFPGEYTLHV